MKLIVQIAVGVILGWLGIQAILYLDARLLLHRPARAAQSSSVSPLNMVPHLPAVSSPTPIVTVPEPPQRATKRCEITKADGTTVHCAGLTDQQ